MEDFKLNTIEEAIADFREGKFIIVVDDEDRENEGDFIIAAEKKTPARTPAWKCSAASGSHCFLPLYLKQRNYSESNSIRNDSCCVFSSPDFSCPRFSSPFLSLLY